MFSEALTSAEIEAVIIFGSFAVGYTVYYFLFHSDYLTGRFRRRFAPERAEILRNSLYRLVQFLVLGVVPMLLLAGILGKTVADYGLLLQWDWGQAGVIAALSVVVVGIIWINPGKQKLVGQYPQMRITEWTGGHVAVNVATWALYLLAYELMFRGFMLVALLPFGVWVAVSVNIAVYVLAHIPKGLSEAVGAIPFGLLVCWLTLAFGSIWPAFWLHLALALANSFFALAANPEMRLTTSPASERASRRSASPDA